MKTRLYHGFLLISLNCWSLSAGASLLTYEGFDYGVSTNFKGSGTFSGDSSQWDGFSGGSGWGSNWGWAAGSLGNAAVVSPGLTYTDANSNVMTVTGNTGEITRSTRSAERDFSATYSSGTYWLGFLVAPTYTAGLLDDAHAFSLQLRNNTSTIFSVGNIDNADTTYGIQRGSKALSSTAPVLNETVFLAVRYHIGSTSSDGSVHLFINPLLDAEPALGTADAALTGLNSATMAFNRLALQTPAANPSGETGRNRAKFDEIRLGTTYAAVSTIPEPSSLVLLGLAGLAGLLWRRKR